MKYRIRKKGDKYMVEKLENNKWIGKTLFPKKIWDMLVSNNVSSDVSDSTKESNGNRPEKFAQDLLSEHEERDIIKGSEEDLSLEEPSGEEVDDSLKEIFR